MRFLISTVLVFALFGEPAPASIYSSFCGAVVRKLSSKLPSDLRFLIPVPVKPYGSFELRNSMYGWMHDSRFANYYPALAEAAEAGRIPTSSSFQISVKKGIIDRKIKIAIGDRIFSEKNGDTIHITREPTEIIYKIQTSSGEVFEVSLSTFEGSNLSVEVTYNGAKLGDYILLAE